MSTDQHYQDFLRRHHRPAHGRRTAARNAPFLLTYLEAGMALIDLGCGPGSITAGLADAVAPGRAVGIDMAPGPGAGGAVTFVGGDVTALPFADASFDALFAHTLLQHLADPLVVLREARRVARPGAVIGVCDADWDSSLLAPPMPLLDRAAEIRSQLRTGSSPRVGKHLRNLLHEAGFVRAQASARSGGAGTAEAVRGHGFFEAAFFGSPEVVDHVVGQGWSTREEMAAISSTWTEWGQHPGAFFAGFMIEAVAWAE